MNNPPSWADTNSCCTTSVSERWGRCAATWGKSTVRENTVTSEVAQLIALIRLTLPHRTEWTLCVSAVLGHRGILCAAFTVWQSRETNTDVTFFAEVWGLKSRVVLFFPLEGLSVDLGANCEHHSATCHNKPSHTNQISSSENTRPLENPASGSLENNFCFIVKPC